MFGGFFFDRQDHPLDLLFQDGPSRPTSSEAAEQTVLEVSGDNIAPTRPPPLCGLASEASI